MTATTSGPLFELSLGVRLVTKGPRTHAQVQGS
jgi:hypothetical protein